MQLNRQELEATLDYRFLSVLLTTFPWLPVQINKNVDVDWSQVEYDGKKNSVIAIRYYMTSIAWLFPDGTVMLNMTDVFDDIWNTTSTRRVMGMFLDKFSVVNHNKEPHIWDSKNHMLYQFVDGIQLQEKGMIVMHQRRMLTPVNLELS